ncbi:MAG: DNA repair protein RecO, partial [Bryobacteraceae bacterium]
ITYFSLWATRLSGFLPDLAVQPKLEEQSRAIAKQMLHAHISSLPDRVWTKDTAADLRRFLIRRMEEHAERRFLTPAILEGL